MEGRLSWKLLVDDYKMKNYYTNRKMWIKNDNVFTPRNPLHTHMLPYKCTQQKLLIYDVLG